MSRIVESLYRVNGIKLNESLSGHLKFVDENKLKEAINEFFETGLDMPINITFNPDNIAELEFKPQKYKIIVNPSNEIEWYRVDDQGRKITGSSVIASLDEIM